MADVKERLAQSILHDPRYYLRDYFDDLSLAYAVSDLIVCRAGAMTVSELAITGKPAIFIPFPFAAADHQTHNARFVESRGGAVVMRQDELTAEKLVETVVQLIADDHRRESMGVAMSNLGKPGAAEALASQIKVLSAAKQARSSKTAT